MSLYRPPYNSNTTQKGNLTHSRWRLSNGSSPAEGRLEYKSEDGDWVCVCSSGFIFTKSFGDKICQELGFKQMLSYYDFSSMFLFGRCPGEIFMPVRDVDNISAIPYGMHGGCATEYTYGLHCVNSK